MVCFSVHMVWVGLYSGWFVELRYGCVLFILHLLSCTSALIVFHLFASSWVKGISPCSMLASWMPRCCSAFGPMMEVTKILASAILAAST